MARPKAAIIDCQIGNMFSVERACEFVGLEPNVTFNARAIESADAVILPGVGAFAEAMASLQRHDLVGALRQVIASGKPFLGICLGMQLLFSESEEFGKVRGLDIISGQVVRFPASTEDGRHIRVPHIGWNGIRRHDARSWVGTPLEPLAGDADMYFVHSYYAQPSHPAVMLCTTEYEGIHFCSGVALRNVFAFQFHPEKSANEGLEIYAAFAAIVRSSGR
jgi:glutamine amidotransferase